jgi:hypothetical protein
VYRSHGHGIARVDLEEHTLSEFVQASATRILSCFTGLALLPSESGCIREAGITDSCTSIRIMHGQSHDYSIQAMPHTELELQHYCGTSRDPLIIQIIIENIGLGPYAYSEGFDYQTVQLSIEYGKPCIR